VDVEHEKEQRVSLFKYRNIPALYSNGSFFRCARTQGSFRQTTIASQNNSHCSASTDCTGDLTKIHVPNDKTKNKNTTIQRLVYANIYFWSLCICCVFPATNTLGCYFTATPTSEPLQ